MFTDLEVHGGTGAMESDVRYSGVATPVVLPGFLTRWLSASDGKKGQLLVKLLLLTKIEKGLRGGTDYFYFRILSCSYYSAAKTTRQIGTNPRVFLQIALAWNFVNESISKNLREYI
jgi:hypothetical protein